MRAPETAIAVEGVSLAYQARQGRVLRGAWQSMRPSEPRTQRTIQALTDVTLTVNRGETFGIVGTNGAGKSSLLKVLAGVLPRHAGESRSGARSAPCCRWGSASVGT